MNKKALEFTIASEPISHVFSIGRLPDPSFNFCTSKGLLLSLKPDGTIEKGPAFTTLDQASHDFLDAVGRAFPEFIDRIADKKTS